MIVLIGGEKGGTGKSTLATNLAVCLAEAGKDVLVLDTDRQATASSWCAERATHEDLTRVHCVQKYGNVFETLQDLSKRYEEVIVDAGGRDSPELRSAMVAAHKMVSPAKASQSDLWTLKHLNELINQARALNPKLDARVVLSMTPTNPRIQEAQEAAEMLRSFEPNLRLAKSRIRDRKVYRDAMCDGKGAIECADAKALEEIKSLMQEVYGAEIQKLAAN